MVATFVGGGGGKKCQTLKNVMRSEFKTEMVKETFLIVLLY